jgi:putative proteasome-type protease
MRQCKAKHRTSGTSARPERLEITDMTYCAGILVREGLVMFADTRTNAGFDDISCYRKLYVFETPGERVLAISTSGNLSVTQMALSVLAEGLLNPDTGEAETLETAPSMFRAAQLVGMAVRKVKHDNHAGLEAEHVDSGVALLLGGQIRGGPMRLFMIYDAGNFIECGADSPFLQIGEHKYGRPILVRAVNYETELYDALKIGLISLDSTIQSNLAVGPPVDLLVLRRDALESELNYRIESDEPYFRELSDRWSEALRQAHMSLPRPPYAPPPLLEAAVQPFKAGR